MNETTELAKMATADLVAYRNILLMSARCIQATDDPGKQARHLGIVENLLTERGVPFEPGKTLRRIASPEV